jgi:hypothetical protein
MAATLVERMAAATGTNGVVANTFCPECGAEYEETARMCEACGVLLDGDDTLVYEMDGWEPAERESLGRLLDGEAIPHRWDGDDLVVPGAEEHRVDALMDTIDYPDALEPADEVDDAGDDAAVYGVMSSLFVAADRIAGERVVDVALAGDLVTAAAAAASTPTPFGIEPSAWTRVQELANGVVTAIEAEADDEVVVRDAAALRDLLRPFV